MSWFVMIGWSIGKPESGKCEKIHNFKPVLKIVHSLHSCCQENKIGNTKMHDLNLPSSYTL